MWLEGAWWWQAYLLPQHKEWGLREVRFLVHSWGAGKPGFKPRFVTPGPLLLKQCSLGSRRSCLDLPIQKSWVPEQHKLLWLLGAQFLSWFLLSKSSAASRPSGGRTDTTETCRSPGKAAASVAHFSLAGNRSRGFVASLQVSSLELGFRQLEDKTENEMPGMFCGSQYFPSLLLPFVQRMPRFPGCPCPSGQCVASGKTS